MSNVLIYANYLPESYSVSCLTLNDALKSDRLINRHPAMEYFLE